jgi:hypothetical protein
LIKFYDPERLLLFNIKRDIGETTDISQQMPEKVEDLNKALTDYLELVDARLHDCK